MEYNGAPCLADVRRIGSMGLFGFLMGLTGKQKEAHFAENCATQGHVQHKGEAFSYDT